MQKVVKLLGIISLTVMLGACQTTQTTAVISVNKPNIILPNVDSIRMNDVKWKVIDKNHTDTIFKDSDKLYAVTPSDYGKLSQNQIVMAKSIRQYQAKIKAYKKYYETDANSSNGK